jgi:hypothetical protein
MKILFFLIHYKKPLAFVNTCVFCLIFVGCHVQRAEFPLDSAMITQWKRDKLVMQMLAEQCKATIDTFSFIKSYDSDISTNTVSSFEGCELNNNLPHQNNTYQIIHTARDLDKNQVLFVTNQHRTKQGWWIWEEPILEEKGFLYVSKNDQLPINIEYQPRDKVDLIQKGLDRFVGDYRLTNEAGKIDACEIWMFRSIAPKWYLYYRQNRECQWRGL